MKPELKGGPPIIIVGGGICGLTAAIALAKSGRAVHVLERSAEFSEEGAGIQLGPNATRILQSLGVLPLLNERSVSPDTIDIRKGISGQTLTSLPIAKWAGGKYRAPYIVVHRHTLHQALVETAKAIPDIDITLGFDLRDIQEFSDRLVVFGADGGQVIGSALIGADGIWSRVRSLLHPHAKPIFSGKTAWRSTIPSSDAPEFFKKAAVGLWLAPNAHLVHYPLEGGRLINIVAIIQEKWMSSDWSAPANGADLVRSFGRWCEPAKRLIEVGQNWKRWSLYGLPTLRKWHMGRLVVAGDAAHPMFPFFAQGGAMAIEDAEALVHSLEECNDNYDDAWPLFERKRRARARRVQRASRRNGQIYHLPAFAGWARDMVLTRTPPERLLDRYQWLYGFGA